MPIIYLILWARLTDSPPFLAFDNMKNFEFTSDDNINRVLNRVINLHDSRECSLSIHLNCHYPSEDTPWYYSVFKISLENSLSFAGKDDYLNELYEFYVSEKIVDELFHCFPVLEEFTDFSTRVFVLDFDI